MAEAEMMVGSSPNAAVQDHGGMGILRLLRRWPADQVAAGGHAEPWPGAAMQPERMEPGPAQVSSPSLVIDRRATTLALRDTLAAWRAAQRELDGLVVGSRDWARSQAEVDLLRMTHHRLFNQLSVER